MPKLPVLGRHSSYLLFALTALAWAGCAPSNEVDSFDDSEEKPQALEGALLPDIVVRESDLHTNYRDTFSQPGRTLLRLSNGTSNVGAGKLHLYGVLPANADGSQTVMQRVFNAQGQFEDRVAGTFLYHPQHSHMHVENWASYRIRQITANDGVGPILAQGQKTSFCILDLAADPNVPGYLPGGEFHSCGSQVQGLSVGWTDVYGAGLEGQSIDITDVPAGTYWLESIVDPDDKVLESDETNNATRIKLTIGAPELGQDSFEPNDLASAVLQAPAGTVNSPNLGPVNPSRTIDNLTIHTATDVDHFRFLANDTGSTADFVEITFDAAQGDLDLELRDDVGNVVATSDGTGTSSERISLEGRPEGYYSAVVRGKSGATSPHYKLTIDPPANQPPALTITAPAAGNVDVVHAVETFTSTWQVSDPENDPTWVTVWLNKTPSFDGQQVLLETSLHTPGELGFHIVNTSYVTEGTYWVYMEVTDGGSTVGRWSDGTVSFTANPVCVHAVCQQGAKLNAPVCDACTQQICATDSYCCTTAWDSVCVSEVASICQATCPSTSAISATAAARGASLVLTGAGLAGATSVSLGGVSQPLVIDSPTQITIPAIADTTPLGAQSLYVTTPLGTTTASTVNVFDLLINELDSDQSGSDTKEFVEISTGVPNQNLAGYTLVLWNGTGDVAYLALDLSSVTTDAQGLAVVGNSGVVPAPALTWANNYMQNGADAVAIYQGAPASFPNGAALTTSKLIDALVYDTSDPDDATLLTLTTDNVQVNEGTTATKSIKRCGPGRRLGAKFVVKTNPSPGAPNGVPCP